MYYVIFLLLFLLGLAFGSFINVLAWRYRPEGWVFGKKVIGGRSHCQHCQRQLRWFELVPLFSFLIIKGRCLTCGKRLSLRYPLVELLSGIVTAGVPYTLMKIYFIKQVFWAGQPIGWFIGLTVLWVVAFYVLIVLSLIDLKWKVIPNELNALLGLVGVGITYVTDIYGKFGLAEGSFVGKYATMFGWRSDIWVNHLAAAGVALLFFLAIVLLSRGKGMGMGDVKLAAVIGILFGWPDAMMIIFLAFILGALVGIALIIKARENIKSLIPFGPFLAVSALLVFWWGQAILDGYFRLFGIV